MSRPDWLRVRADTSGRRADMSGGVREREARVSCAKMDGEDIFIGRGS